MNVKDYIESGILESYLMGQVTDQERREVECMSKIYPEIRASLDEIEADLESYASSHSVKAPDDLKASIMSAIADIEQEPAGEMKVEKSPDPVEEPKEEDLPRIDSKPGSRLLSWTVAAAALIFMVSTVLLWARMQDLATQLSSVQDEKTEVEQLAGKLESSLEQRETQIDLLTSPENKKIVLAATEAFPENSATVFWNPELGEVVMDVSGLTPAPDGQQYQLWALIDGQPKDMGLVSKGTDSSRIQDMLTTNTADAFAITLEPEGGLPEPTLENLVVVGTVAS